MAAFSPGLFVFPEAGGPMAVSPNPAPVPSPVSPGRRWLVAGIAALVVLLALLVGLLSSFSGSLFPIPAAGTQARSSAVQDAAKVDEMKRLVQQLIAADLLADAESVLNNWTELQPNDWQAYRQRMEVRHKLSFHGKTEAEQLRLQNDALDDGLRALALQADDATAREVVWLCLAVGRHDEAERICKQCRQHRPDDPWVLYLQARVSYARGDNCEALALVDEILRKQPPFLTRVLLLRAILYHEADEPMKAIPLFRQVIDQDKARQHEARYFLSLALARAGRANEAQAEMAIVQRYNLDQVSARTGHSDSPAVQVRRAELLLGAGKTDDALNLVHALLRDDPDYFAAHHFLASYYERHGEPAKAAEHRRKAER